MLLDSLGDLSDTSVATDATNNSALNPNDLLYKFLHAGEKYLSLDATDIDHVTDSLTWDRYTSAEDIINEEKRILDKQIQDDVLEDICNNELVHVSTSLRERTSFTYTLFERLCNLIMVRDVSSGSNNSGDVNSIRLNNDNNDNNTSLMDISTDNLNNSQLLTSIPLIRSSSSIIDKSNYASGTTTITTGNDGMNSNGLLDTKALQMEKLYLKDHITKLSSEIITLTAKLQIAENKLIKSEKYIATITESGLIPGNNSNDNNSTVSLVVSEEEAAIPSAAVTNSPEYQRILEEVVLLKKRLDVVNKHLHESELLKTKLQQQLTDKVGKPMVHTEAQITDIRKAMEQLRLQHRTRVNSILADVSTLQQQLSNSEIALGQLDITYQSKFNEVKTSTEAFVQSIQTEKDSMQKELVLLQSNAKSIPLLKQQVIDAQYLESLTRFDNKKLKDKISQLTSAIESKENLLIQSRQREVDMEKRLVQGTGGAGMGEEEKSLISQAQQRVVELESDIVEHKARLNDLICEIEEVATAQDIERSNAAKLMKQVSESQETYKSLLEENMKLRDEINGYKQKLTDLQSK